MTIQETRRASRAKAVALRLLDASSAATSLSVATTRLGRRRRSPITHGSALVAFERSRLALALLISSRRKYRLPGWLSRPIGFCRRLNSAAAPDQATLQIRDRCESRSAP